MHAIAPTDGRVLFATLLSVHWDAPKVLVMANLTHAIV